MAFVFNLRTDAAKAETKQAIFQAVQETFELDIKPAAVKASPVLTGTNRRSIDTDVKAVAHGVQAQLYTQSGYGGYLELGTRFAKAQPYLRPAADKFLSRIGERVRQKLAGLR